jgi:hypothetical protein
MTSDALKAYTHSFSTHTAVARDRFENACRLLEERMAELQRENVELQEENIRLRNVSKEAIAVVDSIVSDVKNLLKE